MTATYSFDLNPELDLVLERVVPVPKELVWKAWTRPEHVKKWFAPRPWTVPHCEIDLRRGGVFRTVMRSPEGQEFDGPGCILDVVQHERLVWTTSMAPGYRPLLVSRDDMPFTATLLLEAIDGGTRYTAIAAHADPDGKQSHEDMGFIDGWGTCLDQLVECIEAGVIS